MSEKVGFIGLGQMGSLMARCLRAHPGGLVVCDVVPEAMARFAAKGVETTTEPEGVVAAGATIVCVMVRDDAQVRDVVGRLLAVAPAGTLVAVHSTIRPETAEDLALVAARRDVHLVDAPVSGSTMGAGSGRLAVLLGADEAVVDRCRDAFATVADKVVHFGPVGAGTRAKIARNLVTFTAYAAVGEAMRLAEAEGVDLMALGDVVRHSDAVTGGAGSIMLRPSAGPLAPDDGLHGVFTHALALGEKDLDLALTLAADAGLDLPLATAARAGGLAGALGLGAAPRLAPTPGTED